MRAEDGETGRLRRVISFPYRSFCLAGAYPSRLRDVGTSHMASFGPSSYSTVCILVDGLNEGNSFNIFNSGQLRLYRELLIPRRPSGPFNPKEFLYNAEWEKMSSIRESLYQLLQLRVRQLYNHFTLPLNWPVQRHDQAASGIEHLLKALWHSEFLCKFNLYRTAIILLADIGLEFGMTKSSRQILEEIMPQIINGDDIEQRAVACFTLSRCIIAAESATREFCSFRSIRYTT